MRDPHQPAETLGRETSAHYADLRATVYAGAVPAYAADQLPSLYSSLLSTVDWFIAADHCEPTGACLLDDPRHVLLFTVDGDTIEILNKVFEIPPADARRACQALFRALPHARRIHLEIMFPPQELHMPKRALYWTDHMVIDLPSTIEEYTASLGKRTRRTVRASQDRLRREFPDMTTEATAACACSQKLFDLFLTWKIKRFASLQRETIWEEQPELAESFIELIRRCGEPHVTSISGKPAAITFACPIGDSIFVPQSSFDPQYSPYKLGFVSLLWVIHDAIQRGAKQVNLMWGSETYKQHLGAKPIRATRLSVFRSPLSRVYSLNEATEVEMRRLKRGKGCYFQARHLVGKMLRTVVGRSHPTTPK